jgi:hypothetical protein
MYDNETFETLKKYDDEDQLIREEVDILKKIILLKSSNVLKFNLLLNFKFLILSIIYFKNKN